MIRRRGGAMVTGTCGKLFLGKFINLDGDVAMRLDGSTLPVGA